MRILITGGSGFLGTNLVSYMLAKGHKVVNFDLLAPRNASLMQHWQPGSIEKRSEVVRAYAEFKPDLVFHLAARTDLHGKSLDEYSANTVGVRNVIDAASRLAKKPRTVYASSRLVFSIDSKPEHLYDYSPSTTYGESKIESERIILNDGDSAGRWTIVRPTSIWGPWFGVPYRNFFDSVRSRRFVNIAGHDPLKSFGYVENSVYQLLSLAQADAHLVDRKVFWLSDYKPLRVSEWAESIADMFAVRRPMTVPFWTVKMAATAGDLMEKVTRKDMPITSFRLNNLITPMVYDTSSTESVVGDLPFTVDAGVQRTISWMRNEDGMNLRQF